MTFRNLVIEGCRLSSRARVTGLIEASSCSSDRANLRRIRLQNVEFSRNRNFGGAVGVVVQDVSCYRVVMQDVQFRSNQHSSSCRLSSINEMRNVSFIENKPSRSRQERALINLPLESNTTITDLLARDNRCSLLRVRGGQINVSDSLFFRNHGNEHGTIVATGADVSISTDRKSTRLNSSH